MSRPQPTENEIHQHDQRIADDLLGEIADALAYLRAGGQGFGTITVQLTVRNGVVSLVEASPRRSIKPDYAK